MDEKTWAWMQTAQTIEEGKISTLSIQGRDVCSRLKERCKEKGKGKTNLAIHFGDGFVQALDEDGTAYDLPGYRFCLVEYTDFPSCRMWLTEPMVAGRAFLPTIKGKPAQSYLWNRWGLMAPQDYHILIQSLPLDEDGARVFGAQGAYQTCSDPLEAPCPYSKK